MLGVRPGESVTTPSSGYVPVSVEVGMVEIAGCEEPDTAQIVALAQRSYRADVALRRVVLARRFSGACLKGLAPSVIQLGEERRWIADLRTFEADEATAIPIVADQVPLSDFDMTGYLADDHREGLEQTALMEHGWWEKSWICPHT